MAKQNHTNILVELSNKVGQLEQGMKELRIHFTNHLSDHKLDRIFMLVQTLIVVGLFCFLKWH